MAAWTNHELRTMAEAHRLGKPSLTDLAGMFPRHSRKSVIKMAGVMKHRSGITSAHLKWLRIAHRHFAVRDAQISSMRG